jgi:hypothetical protein
LKLNSLDPTARLDEMRRKMVEIVVREYFTPIRRDLNVEIKKVMKLVEDTSQNLGYMKMK